MADKPLPIINDKTKERFWRKVNIADSESCWEWTASKATAGYGAFGCKDVTGKNRVYHAHQFCMMMETGERPQGAHCCHTCDNRLCVNPKHLWWGSVLENKIGRAHV